uniref:hypothetical protein n=1 Tax=uncultured Erythrobacter sp. TaxID=263913 RepID=UPI0026089D35|nr:hypothetical protein [uncultured Erythrobacter sp.]
MTKLATRITVAMAAASMAFTPIAAHANTRAGDSGSVYGAEASSAGAIFGSVYDDEEIAGLWGDLSTLIAALLAAAAIAGVIIIVDDSDDQSPGT